MAPKFEVIEVPFDPIDFSPSLEDEFTMTAVLKEIESTDNVEELRLGATNLLKVAMHRQAIIRSLCKRLAKVETYGTHRTKIEN